MNSLSIHKFNLLKADYKLGRNKNLTLPQQSMIRLTLKLLGRSHLSSEKPFVLKVEKESFF